MSGDMPYHEMRWNVETPDLRLCAPVLYSTERMPG